ncbi:TetR family transcriptional regulator [Gordonia sp. HY285]|uniref:TetR/AcrR family transcriptional regulator n=1 Tax=Gordonia liuliyuniae TaxID=2911517 RepID=UPI001F3F9171|nr:TetR family transcriptional regulator [Gordonia liuliyuniae]MCF8610795.1 TetR family transcriptional regulator [Gordonia liuliyuniae]
MSDRRAQIADAALDLAAQGGNRAVTHSAVDRLLDLPKGSTSYYFRTRRALLDAALAHLTATSGASFEASAGPGPADTDPAALIGRYLHTLTTSRRRDVHARFALAPDAAHDHALADSLRDSLFSRSGAVALFTALDAADPESDADDLLVFCEGVAASHLFSGTSPSAAALTAAVRRRFVLTSQQLLSGPREPFRN